MPRGRQPRKPGAALTCQPFAGSSDDTGAAPENPAPDQGIIHATCVAFIHSGWASDTSSTPGLPRGVIILGASGSGKSALGLQLIGLGAVLVADDRTMLRAQDGVLTASAPNGLPPLIEARGIGLLRAETCAEAAVVLAVDLDAAEGNRLPPRRSRSFCNAAVDLVSGRETPYFPSAIRQYILYGRQD